MKCDDGGHIAPEVLKEIEKKLKVLHGDLARERNMHGEEMRQEADHDQAEALPMKEELDVVEKQDSMEEEEMVLVEEALRRIADGTFGCCLDCGKTISTERLKALPYAKHCVSCKSKREG